MGSCNSAEKTPDQSEKAPDQSSLPYINPKPLLDEYSITKVLMEYPEITLFEAVSRKNGSTVVIKRYRFSSFNNDKIKEEISIHKKMDVPEVLKPFEMFYSKTEANLVIEFSKSPKLTDYIIENRISKSQIASILLTLLKFLEMMRRKRIFFGGIMLRYLFFDGTTLRFCNFSHSQHCKSKVPLTPFKGDVRYKAPEMIKGNYGCHADVWALGVLGYLLLTGKFPFSSGRDYDTEQLILNQAIDFSAISDPKAADFVRLCLQKETKDRMVPSKLIEHKFFKEAQRDKAKEPMDIDFKLFTDLRKKDKLAASFYHIIVMFLLDDTERRDLELWFDEFDANGDRKISFQEYFAKLSSKTSQPTVEEAKELFAKLDHDSSGTIEWSEFVTAFVNVRKALTEEKIKQCFALFADPDSQTIKLEKVQSVFIRGTESQRAISTSLKDYGKDEEMTYPQFEKMMNKIATNYIESQKRLSLKT